MVKLSLFLKSSQSLFFDWNARYGTSFDVGDSANSLAAIENGLLRDPKVQQSARVNSRESFRNTIRDQIKEVLTRNYTHNTEWYKFLLNIKDAQSQLVEILANPVFNQIRRALEED